MFFGPEPEIVIQQYTKVTGSSKLVLTHIFIRNRCFRNEHEVKMTRNLKKKLYFPKWSTDCRF